ncbi:hypothetical protein MTR67_052102 [Solanum verrucosum]|uniref:DUF4216 domain-containing protein n=1 Tax=Solanum verrucosum TaxID=315347 RepID=A0AAF0V5L7_SOLVR|nr:hypothetical protein MTR67_052102 [Solanum verrucosum]
MRGMILDAFGGCTEFIDSEINERGEMEPNVQENAYHLSENQPHKDMDKFERLMKEVNELEATSNIIKDDRVLAQGPSFIARRFIAFNVNNEYRFRTKQSEEFKETQNSGVMVVSKTKSYARSCDNALKSANITYYGRGVKDDELGFTLVNFSRLEDIGNRKRHEPFIFAEHDHQAIFIKDHVAHEWFVPRLIKPRDIFYMGDENSVQLESSMQSDLTDLSLLETACVAEYECDDWVRSGLDGIVIETNLHSHASTNDGEANVEGRNDIENESDS